jgi:adenine/guanine phosphoribosyltransferase-like PRPP-binding protein
MIQLIYVGLLHYLIVNPYEKILAQILFKDVNRPLDKCKTRDISLACLGMPSGHAEVTSIIIFLLLLQNKITALIAVIIITIIGSQRILANMHTLSQVCVGMILGLIYAIIYFKLDSLLYIVIISICYIITLMIIILSLLDQKVYEPIPEWVDQSLYPIIIKKQNQPFLTKLYQLLYILPNHRTIVLCTWNMLEKFMDELLSLTDQKFDLIVGIKTGGAIMSNYMSKKLNIPYKYIKTAKICDTEISEFYYSYKKEFSNEFYICEGIDDDLTGLNILLVDEQIVSGRTIRSIYSYLLNKKVKSITICCISNLNKNFEYKIYSLNNNYYAIYPWGYAN